MKRPFWIILLGLFAISGNAQVPLPLDSAVAMAWSHLRMEDQLIAIERMKEVDRAIVQNAWYPTLTLSAQSTIQNEQINFPGSVPGFEPPEIPLDFHRILLQFNQTIYDGSINTRTKRLRELEGDRMKIELETQKLSIRQSVTQIYLNLLLIGDRLEITKLRKTTLEVQSERIEGAVSQGAMIPAERSQIRAEILQTEQEIQGILSLKKRMEYQLANLIGEESMEGYVLIHPDLADRPTENMDRPEIRLIDQQITITQAQQQITQSQNLPKFSLFGNVGGGTPGYNLFDPSFSPMLYAGIGLTWQPIHWNKVKKQRERLALQANVLQMEKERSTIRFENERTGKWEEYQRLSELSSSDQEIVKLRKEVTESKSAQLENGVITTSEYLVELNKEHSARLNASIHDLEATMAYIEYLILSGK
ncbi:MAG: TolC family protein [Bacteroidota bacterium]|nr:TolC family protein [Bacteroidota bacterium]